MYLFKLNLIPACLILICGGCTSELFSNLEAGNVRAATLPVEYAQNEPYEFDLATFIYDFNNIDWNDRRLKSNSDIPEVDDDTAIEINKTNILDEMNHKDVVDVQLAPYTSSLIVPLLVIKADDVSAKPDKGRESNEIELAKLLLQLKTASEKSSGLKSSDILSFLAFVVSLMTFGYSIHQNNKKKSQSIKENFWMREVLIPHYLDGFLAFVKTAPTCYQASDSLGDFYTSYALSELNSIEESTYLLDAGSLGLGTKMRVVLSEFDDAIMDVNNNGELLTLLSELSSKSIKIIQNAQGELS